MKQDSRLLFPAGDLRNYENDIRILAIVDANESGGKSDIAALKRKVVSDIAALTAVVSGINATLSALKFAVLFDSDGGSPVTPQVVTNGAKATQPTPPIKASNTFAGWVDADSAAFDFATAITNTTLLKATWTAE